LVSQAVPIKPLRFSISGRREPAREPRALNERKIVLPLEPMAGSVIHADIAQWSYPQLGILSATLGGLRHGANAGPARAGHEDHLYFGITLAGRSVAQQRRGEVTLRDGEGVLLSAPEGFTMTHPEQVKFLGLRLSRAVLGTRLNKIDDAMMRVVRRDTPALALLTRYLGIALDDALPATSGLQGLVASHVYELAAMAIGAEDERAVSANALGVRAARLRALKADIVANCDDCELSVSAVAARHGVTPRYVHKLFESEGLTYSGFVLGQRLDRVHRMLTDPQCAGHSISALAFRAGFGDLSYFNRAFRRRYGATPSDIRRYGQYLSH
jgi:AraC-like DNA-binding protein